MLLLRISLGIYNCVIHGMDLKGMKVGQLSFGIMVIPTPNENMHIVKEYLWETFTHTPP